MFTKKFLESIQKKILKREVAIAKERDAIDEMISDLTDLREVCQESYLPRRGPRKTFRTGVEKR